MENETPAIPTRFTKVRKVLLNHLQELVQLVGLLAVAYTLLLTVHSYEAMMDQNYLQKAMEREPVLRLLNDSTILDTVASSVRAKVSFDTVRFGKELEAQLDTLDLWEYVKVQSELPVQLTFKFHNSGSRGRARVIDILIAASTKTYSTSLLLDQVLSDAYKPAMSTGERIEDRPIVYEDSTYEHKGVVPLSVMPNITTYVHVLCIYDNLFGSCYGSYSIHAYKFRAEGISSKQLDKLPFVGRIRSVEIKPLVSGQPIQRPVVFDRKTASRFLESFGQDK